MRMLLTGAAGFIGSRVARAALARGWEVVALVRPGSAPDRLHGLEDRIEWVAGSVGDTAALRDLLAGRPPEVCLHLAWFTTPGVYWNSPENPTCVADSLRLLRLLDEIGCGRTVIAGTCAEYLSAEGPLAEDATLSASSLYAACKLALAATAAHFQSLRGRSLVWARLFHLYGPGEHPARLVPQLIQSLRVGQPCPLTAGTQVRDFLHVHDVAAALLAVTESGVEGPVNVGSGVPATVRELAVEVATQMGRTDLLRFSERPLPPNDPPSLLADVGKLRRETGWTPAFDLRAGVADTIEWWGSRQP